MKKSGLIFAVLIIFQLYFLCDFAEGKAKALSAEELAKVEENVDSLVKKVYASSLFAPEDAEKLVDTRTKLDEAMSANIKDPVYARLFFDVGYICKEREYVDESIRYFKLVNEKFPDTPYAARAVNELNKLGVNPLNDGEENEEE